MSITFDDSSAEVTINKPNIPDILDEDWNEIVGLSKGLSTLFSYTIPAAKLRNENPGNILLLGVDSKLFNIIVGKIATELGKEIYNIKIFDRLTKPENVTWSINNCPDNSIYAMHGNTQNANVVAVDMLSKAIRTSTIDVVIGSGPARNEITLEMPKLFYVIGDELECEKTPSLTKAVDIVIDMAEVPEETIYKAEIRMLLSNEQLYCNEADLLRIAYMVPRSIYNPQGIVKYLSDFMLINKLGNEITGEIIDKAFGEKKNQTKEKTYSVSDLDNLGHEDFTNAIISLLSAMGYNCSSAKGVSFIAERDALRMGVVAIPDNSSVGVSAVSDIVSCDRKLDLDKGLIITNGVFSPQATKLAKITHTSLWDRDKLQVLFNEYFGS